MTADDQTVPARYDQSEPEPPLGTAFGLWVGAATLSNFGSKVQSFSLTWEASASGAALTTTIAIVAGAPGIVLIMMGGALTDRYGARQIMIVCDTVMCGVVSFGLLAIWLWSVTVPLLLGLALVGGTVSAFYQPASGSFPRSFTCGDNLAKATARVGGLGQIARIIGPSAGAALVVALGLGGVLGINLVSFLLILLVLVGIRPPREKQIDTPAPARALTSIRSGLYAAWRIPGMRASLLALACVAGTVLPVLFLCLPLLVRHHGWGASAAGWIESAWIIGSLSLTAIIANHGPLKPIGRMLIVGPILASLGIAGVALAPGLWIALPAAVVMGIGTMLFSGQLAPLYLSWTPPELTGRFQALFGLIQALASLIVDAPYGVIAARIGPTTAMLVAAGICLVATGVILTSHPLRSCKELT